MVLAIYCLLLWVSTLSGCYQVSCGFDILRAAISLRSIPARFHGNNVCPNSCTITSVVYCYSASQVY